MEIFNDNITLCCYYEQLINVRNVEINHFWNRMLSLIGIQGVILSFFIGSFCVLFASPYPIILIISSIFGFFLAVASFFIIYASRLWLEYYEEKVKTFEELINKMNNGSQIPFGLFCDKTGRDKVKIIYYTYQPKNYVYLSVSYMDSFGYSIFFI
ncbi:RipA family octameric membrane protein [Methanocorpusculum sp.]